MNKLFTLGGGGETFQSVKRKALAKHAESHRCEVNILGIFRTLVCCSKFSVFLMKSTLTSYAPGPGTSFFSSLNLLSLRSKDPPGTAAFVFKSYFPGPGLFRSGFFATTSRGLENRFVDDKKAPFCRVEEIPPLLFGYRTRPAGRDI